MNSQTPIVPISPELYVLSEQQLAETLGISVFTLRRMRAKGDGPRCINLSERRIGYRFRDVKAWLDARGEEAGG